MRDNGMSLGIGRLRGVLGCGEFESPPPNIYSKSQKQNAHSNKKYVWGFSADSHGLIDGIAEKEAADQYIENRAGETNPVIEADQAFVSRRIAKAPVDQ
jgi:hypothetical protein